MKRYCLIGIKGIGKTTLVKSIMPISNTDYFIGSDILKNLVGPEFENFDYFPEEKKQKYRKKAIEYLWKIQEKNKKNILIDGHVTLLNPKTRIIEPVFTELDCNFYTDLILLEAPIEEILKRRKNDNRKKRIIDIELIRKELTAERHEAERLSNKYGINIHYVFDDGTSNSEQALRKIFNKREIQ